ncbi:MAG: hypothetical protein E6534_05885, partial [Corynebacterium kroppenstedtii]|nr:hypothetical protein [Corynebacterium kroppenstedtii]
MPAHEGEKDAEITAATELGRSRCTDSFGTTLEDRNIRSTHQPKRGTNTMPSIDNTTGTDTHADASTDDTVKDTYSF